LTESAVWARNLNVKQDCFYFLWENKGVMQYRITVAMRKQDGKRLK